MVTMKSHIKNPTVQTTVFGQSVGKGPTKEPRPSLQELVDENINSTRLVDNNLYHFVIES
ncbi:unnamed protein product [Arabidopsis lyrata]|uniref:Uncharacterized protein n=1 Tax=Arabidopsis lyrata subsp. lyrata TaxID=81972 RepID=D7KRZ0_ARALL|nr:hypothetical protein ARALYDRAFT_476551 [Arabidopsis lyrata subsp. lyrata]CAH8258119.1 unnamed protein product [Arabidopsis lyrata]